MSATIKPVVDRTPEAQARNVSVAAELSRLRSEFREMKFSVSMLGRQVGRQERISDTTGILEVAPEIFDSPHYESYLELVEIGLAPEKARDVMHAFIRDESKTKTIETALGDLLGSSLSFAGDYVTVDPRSAGAPAAAIFIGPTGVGKTTTIAKLAAGAALGGRSCVELITLDTYRIAAVEQLKRYAEVIGVGCHIARTVSELDELVKRFAGKSKVFVDTAGRSPNDLADQMELADYLRDSSHILKYLVLQATIHPADAMIAARKFALFNPDQLVITKLDETVRPGASVSIASDARFPLAYICAGQRIPEDIQRATPANLARRILRATIKAAAAAA